MPNPDVVIWGLIAIAAILLWPIRNWMRKRYDSDRPAEGDEPPDDWD